MYNNNRVHSHSPYMSIALLCIIANIAALIIQFMYHELPCPLCLLQRFGILGVGFGAILGINHLRSWKYDMIIIFSSLFTLLVAVRQVLLHIAPSDPGYGSTFLGIHLYSWSALLSFVFLVMMAMFPIFRGYCDKWMSCCMSYSSNMSSLLTKTFAIIVFINIVSTYLECGFSLCVADPVNYIKLAR